MGSVTPKNIFSPPDQEARMGHALPMPFASFLFLMKTTLQIFIIPHASYAWSTCFFLIPFANYAIQIVRYHIIYLS